MAITSSELALYQEVERLEHLTVDDPELSPLVTELERLVIELTMGPPDFRVATRLAGRGGVEIEQPSTREYVT